MNSLNQLEDQAVEHAVNARWTEAIEVNNQILIQDFENLAANLRIGYANLQLSNLEEAKKAYETALKIQPKNNIAEEHLEKIKILIIRKKKPAITQTKFNPDIFIEIPGKTKTVTLVNLGQKEDLAGISIGQEVLLKEKRRRLEVRNKEDEYIGSLPDDISKRLTYFINEGSIYEVHVKEVGLTAVVVFIREISKGKKVRQFPSFPTNPHIMLSDINQIDEDEENDSKVGSEDEDINVDEDDGDTPITTFLGDEDEEWEELDEEKDLSTIVQIENQEEEEEE
jgi:tetratricopeptide (TPR) repeat protein